MNRSALLSLLLLGCDPAVMPDGGGPDVPELDVPELDAPGRDVPALDVPELDAPELDVAALADAPSAAGPYVEETRTLDVGGETRTFVLSRPEGIAPNLPLVFSFHGDGGSGAGMRGALPLEAEAASGAVFVYPDALGDAFEYWSYDGRTREAALVSALIASLSSELGIDTTRVFLTGFSGGAVMANAIACRLERDTIRGIAVNSGSLYATTGPSGPEFTDVSGAASCALPAGIVIWGMADVGGGTVYADSGLPTRDLYVATDGCAATTTPWSDAPCVAYDGCEEPMVFCPIPDMGHAIWSGAAPAIWRFFTAL